MNNLIEYGHNPENPENVVDAFEDNANNIPSEQKEEIGRRVDLETADGIVNFHKEGYTDTELEKQSGSLLRNIQKHIGDATGDQTRAYYTIVSDLRTLRNNSESARKTISKENLDRTKTQIITRQKNIIKENQEKSDFYDKILDVCIQKDCPKDPYNQALSQYIKNNIQKKEYDKIIDSFFSNGIDKGEFDDKKIQYAVVQEYGKIVGKDLIPSVKKYEILFKKEENRKHISENIQTLLDKYSIEEPFKQEYKSAIEEKYHKLIKKADDAEIRNRYRSISGDKKLFNSDIKKDVIEKLTDYNKLYIYGQMKQAVDRGIDGVEKGFLKHFETMLDKTSDKVINTFAEALNYPGQNPKILEGIAKKIETNGRKKSIRFTSAKISDGEIDPRKGNENDNTYKYETTIHEKETTTSIDTAGVAGYLQELTKNPDISDIKISIPNKIGIGTQITDILESDQYNSIKEKITIIGGDTGDIRFDVIEKKKEKHELVLERLEANMIGNPKLIYDKLAENPKMNEIINNPAYKIVGGEITGMASRNFTRYDAKFPDNESITSRLNTYIAPQNNLSDTNISNNPGLAFDRAAAFLNYFLSIEGKVGSDSNFTIKHEVAGDTRTDLTSRLTNELQRNPTEGDILEAFKERQNATIKLVLEKTETSTKSIPLKEEKKSESFAITIAKEATRTGGSGYGGGGTFNRIPRQTNYTIPSNRVACYHF